MGTSSYQRSVDVDDYSKHCLTMIAGQKGGPLAEVKNILEPLKHNLRTPGETTPTVRCPSPFPLLATPAPRQLDHNLGQPSAMKGVILTATGQPLATPAPGSLATLFVNSPKVGLNFTKIFDFETQGEPEVHEEPDSGDDGSPSPPPSPSARKSRQRNRSRVNESDSSEASTSSAPQQPVTVPPTRLRRPSIRTSRITASTSDPVALQTPSAVKPLPHPHLERAATAPIPPLRAVQPTQRPQTSPEYDLLDEENLPSPFLKRVERRGTVSKRPSSGNILRAVAAANTITRRGPSLSNATIETGGRTSLVKKTSSEASARKNSSK